MSLKNWKLIHIALGAGEAQDQGGQRMRLFHAQYLVALPCHSDWDNMLPQFPHLYFGRSKPLHMLGEPSAIGLHSQPLIFF